MKKIAFVILHYCAMDTTICCVESVINCVSYPEYHIVLVDNASPDGSGIKLKNKFKNNIRIHVLLNPKNEGFSCGNNIGYEFARIKLCADFIIVMNNDVMIRQKDFVDHMLNTYNLEKYHVMGPDVITLSGEHQSPHRLVNLELKDLNRIIRNRTIILLYLKIKRILHLQNKVQIVERWDQRRIQKEKQNISSRLTHTDVVLHGSILIFSPSYVYKEKYAFYPETFMWMEEEILAYICKRKGYKMLYDPSLAVLHEEGKSTGFLARKDERYYLYSVYLRKSAMVMKKLMMKEEK